MTDREILDKYIDLNKSCLTESEKKEVGDMVYRQVMFDTIRKERSERYDLQIQGSI